MDKVKIKNIVISEDVHRQLKLKSVNLGNVSISKLAEIYIMKGVLDNTSQEKEIMKQIKKKNVGRKKKNAISKNTL